MELNSDFKDLLSALSTARVRYLVVGGYAVMQHTEPRYTNPLSRGRERVRVRVGTASLRRGDDQPRVGVRARAVADVARHLVADDLRRQYRVDSA
jgi:hypothetical protein